MPTKKGKISAKGSTNGDKWLIMVYMEAGDNSNLDSLAVQDLIEIQEGIQGALRPRVGGRSKVGANPNVVALVQMQRKWPDLPQWYFIGPGSSVENKGAAKHKGVATKASVKKFLSEGKKIGKARGVTRFCLVLWGHNFGLGFGRDHDDPLTIKELAEALAEWRKEEFEGQRLDLLATNSCTMAYIEAAFELRESVHYLVASQVFMPPKGFPYCSILSSIAADTTPLALGNTFVEEYVDSFATSPDGEKVAMSLLDLDGTKPFKQMLEDTASKIQNVMKQGQRTIVQKTLREMQDVFLANLAGDTRPVLDLQSLCNNLVEYCKDCLADQETARLASSPKLAQSKGPSSFVAALMNLQKAGEKLGNKTLTFRSEPAARGPANSKTPSLVLSSTPNPDLGSLGGVGVFAPFVVDRAMRTLLEIESDKARVLYESLAIFEGTDKSWPDLVYNTLRRDEPDEIVDATGVVQPADRKLVNQMAGAVDAAFNTFDRVLKSSKPILVKLLGVRATRSPVKNGAPFGPPRLKLTGDLSLQAPGRDRRPAKVPEGVVREFERIEGAARLIETTIKGVMTNSSFGLGPSVKSDSPLGASVKSDSPLGASVKSDSPLGALVKSESLSGSGDVGAELGTLTTFLSSDTQVAMLGVTAMFQALAAVLRNLETAVSNIEQAAAECQLQPGFGSALSPQDYHSAMEQRLAHLFDVAAETGLQARRTARNVMAHPVYGLGRGPEDFGQQDRDQLAITAGLSRRQLMLL